MRFAEGSLGARGRSSILVDLELTAALLLAAELEIVLAGLGADSAALAALATLPLTLRRRLPVVSFACVAVLAPALDRALGSPWGEDANALVFLVLIAAYSVGAHAPLRRSLPALLGAAASLASLEAIAGDGEDYAFLLLLLGVPWLSGRGVRRYRRQAARLRALASQLERERAMSERVAIARERQRMAHETHDGIAHAVGEMVLQATGAEQVLERDPARARKALADIQATGRAAVDELRGILGILRSGDEPPRPVDGDAALEAAATPRGRAWPASLDAALALVLLALGIAYATDTAELAGQRAIAGSLQFGAAAAVALRGPRPFAALPLAVATFAGEALLVGGDPGSPATLGALLLTTYSAATRADRRRGLAVAALALGVPAALAFALGDADVADVALPVTIVGIPWLSGRAVAGYRRQSHELSLLTARLARERDARARLAVLNERARVARELHDAVAHAVSVMVLQAGAAEQVLDRDPAQARAAMRAVQAVGREALDQLGTLLGLFAAPGQRPDLAPRSSLAQLDSLLATVRQAGLPVEVTTFGNAQPLPPALDGAAFRVIQEALTNTLKHSAAAPTEVTIRYAVDGLHLAIVDAGAPSHSIATDGHGLAGMRERVMHHGGRLRAGPAPDGSGFVVSAFLPYAATLRVDRERVHA